jgi:hypothetical protein
MTRFGLRSEKYKPQCFSIFFIGVSPSNLPFHFSSKDVKQKRNDLIVVDYRPVLRRGVPHCCFRRKPAGPPARFHRTQWCAPDGELEWHDTWVTGRQFTILRIPIMIGIAWCHALGQFGADRRLLASAVDACNGCRALGFHRQAGLSIS